MSDQSPLKRSLLIGGCLSDDPVGLWGSNMEVTPSDVDSLGEEEVRGGVLDSSRSAGGSLEPRGRSARGSLEPRGRSARGSLEPRGRSARGSLEPWVECLGSGSLSLGGDLAGISTHVSDDFIFLDDFSP